jgi:hypothetical protein
VTIRNLLQEWSACVFPHCLTKLKQVPDGDYVDRCESRFLLASHAAEGSATIPVFKERPRSLYHVPVIRKPRLQRR